MRARPQANGLVHLIAATPLLLSLYGCDDGKGDTPLDDAGGAAPTDGGAGPGEDDADARADTGEPDAALGEDGGAATPTTGAYVLTADHTLSAIDPSTGALLGSVSLSGLGEAERALGMDVRPKDGLLYVLTSAAKLYTVDVDTGALSEVSSLSAAASDTSEPFTALSGQRFSVDFNPVADRLRVVSEAGQNLRIDVSTGATITDGAVDPRAQPLAAGYTHSFAAACRTQLFVVDGAAGALALQDPPNDGVLVPIGPLGELTGDVVSLDVQTDGEGTNRAVLVTHGPRGAALYDVSLTTGAASAVRTLALPADAELVGFAFTQPEEAPSQARGELVGLGEDGSLVSFNRGAPGKPCTTAQVSGLGSGEQLLGIDLRPADGALYGLGSGGRLYTVDLDTGAATLKSTLAAAATDTSDPFVALAGDADAIGFNPVPDRLRVVTRSGQNLRIDVDTGAVITDAPTSSGAALSALAYTNSFAGAKSTTLYALDTDADRLVRVGGVPASGGACDGASPDVGNPNCGVVTAVGTLGLGADVGSVNGFDIDAKNGVALAALALGDAASSTLYQIDLSTGAAALPRGTASGTIAGARLRGLAFAGNPVLTAHAVTAADELVSFRVSAPGTLLTRAPITGLGSGEHVLGIDVRSADGRLYALGSTGKLYVLDPAAASAGGALPLTPAQGDDAPFSGFGQGATDVDFNPVADLLRVVDSDGQNLRVAPSARGAFRSGDVISDARLNPGSPTVVAGAYTQAFAGSTSTTLYVVDGALDQLFVQGGVGGTPSPNTGTLSAVGSGLGVAASGSVGFDIAGGHDGLAALALVPAGGSGAGLYSLNLASGVAAPFAAQNAIGDGTLTLRAFALALR